MEWRHLQHRCRLLQWRGGTVGVVRSTVDATGYGTTMMLSGAEGRVGEMEKQLICRGEGGIAEPCHEPLPTLAPQHVHVHHVHHRRCRSPSAPVAVEEAVLEEGLAIGRLEPPLVLPPHDAFCLRRRGLHRPLGRATPPPPSPSSGASRRRRDSQESLQRRRRGNSRRGTGSRVAGLRWADLQVC
jgi:hypothetical protein